MLICRDDDILPNSNTQSTAKFVWTSHTAKPFKIYFSQNESPQCCGLEQTTGKNQSTESVPKKYKLKTLE